MEDATPDKAIGYLVKKQREKKGFTQEGLARKAEITYSWLLKIENGATKDPGILRMKKIADALGLTLDKLIKDTETF
ncbi:MAG: helix-turn-helix domain-containing protein [Dissulfurispiraceae bacterium]